jgi:hypothetical protein
MRRVRIPIWIATSAAIGISACNYSEGDCYLRGESESAGVGGGVIIPGGVGGFGDTPPPGGDTGASACNAPDEQPPPPEFGKPADQYIDCRKRMLDANQCSIVCLEAGTGCGPFAGHPRKSGQGLGQLTWCKNGAPTYTCTYTFANGDGCALTVTPFGSFWVCSYAGGG